MWVFCALSLIFIKTTGDYSQSTSSYFMTLQVA